MKIRNGCIVLAAAMMIIVAMPVFSAGSVVEAPEIKVVIDGKMTTNSGTPILADGHTMLPLRELALKLGVPDDGKHIVWDGNRRTVTIALNTTKIKLAVGSNTATVNGKASPLDSAPMIYTKNQKVYVPFRFVAQKCGKHVEWDPYSHTVFMCSEENFSKMKETEDQINGAMVHLNNIHSTVSESEKAEDFDMKISMDRILFPQEETAVWKVLMSTTDRSTIIPIAKSEKSEVYYTNRKSHIYNSDENTWNIVVYNEKDYQDAIGISKLDDASLCGLIFTESPSSNEIIEEGYTAGGPIEPDQTMKSYAKYVYDRSTKILKTEKFLLTGTNHSGKPFTFTFDAKFDQVNTKEEFNIPEGMPFP